MFSYWEQQSFSYYDHIVVGAGIVGLSAAIELKEKYPQQRVLVLERGLLPTGASTRNAGFACMGSATELLDDLQHTPEADVVALFAARKRGLEILRTRLGDDKIGYKANGSYELVSEQEMGVMNRLDYLNRLLQPITGNAAFRSADNKIKEFGFAGSYSQALIENTCEGELNTGMMMRALMDMAIQKGIVIKTGAEVTSFEEKESSVVVQVKDPHRHEDCQLACSTLTICTNAFTKQLLPDADVIPGRGQVMITDVVPGLKIKGLFHFDKGYYYFREIDGRVLFGGGRNLDITGETTTHIGLNAQIQADLEQKLRDIILHETPFTIAQRWAGIMAFGESKWPIVKSFSHRVYGAFRMGGMGVALGSGVAKDVVGMNEYI
jgi:glycine/D-amino acid oxidase-like deaminating enzyme